MGDEKKIAKVESLDFATTLKKSELSLIQQASVFFPPTPTAPYSQNFTIYHRAFNW
jgi:hypothetical protein